MNLILIDSICSIKEKERERKREREIDLLKSISVILIIIFHPGLELQSPAFTMEKIRKDKFS